MRNFLASFHGSVGRIAAIVAAFTLFALISIAHADPKIEDVFRSTQDSFDKPTDSGSILPWLGGAVVLICALVLIQRIAHRSDRPRVVNHQGKLLRALQKEINLKSAELRQLKSLAEDEPIDNPLTLLLCPSLLAKAVKSNPQKVDRRLLTAMLKRVGD